MAIGRPSKRHRLPSYRFDGVTYRRELVVEIPTRR